MPDIAADFEHYATGLVAENHRLFDDEVADPAMEIIMDVAATDPHVLDLDPHVVGVRGSSIEKSSIASLFLPFKTSAFMAASNRRTHASATAKESFVKSLH